MWAAGWSESWRDREWADRTRSHGTPRTNTVRTSALGCISTFYSLVETNSWTNWRWSGDHGRETLVRCRILIDLHPAGPRPDVRGGGAGSDGGVSRGEAPHGGDGRPRPAVAARQTGVAPRLRLYRRRLVHRLRRQRPQSRRAGRSQIGRA